MSWLTMRIILVSLLCAGMLPEAACWRGFLDASQEIEALDACIILLSKLPGWVVPFQDARLPERQNHVLHDAIQLGGMVLAQLAVSAPHVLDRRGFAISQFHKCVPWA